VNNDGSNALNVDTNGDNKRTVRNNQYQVKNFNGVSFINTVSSDESLFRKQIMELEKEVVNLKDRIDEIERILEADEKMIERILELDDKLKKQ
ncbi:MAG: ATP-binding protein, partial [Vulcanisaeta sp.]